MPSQEAPQFAANNSLSRRVVNALHKNPTIIPLSVLLLGLLVFSLVVGGRFYHPFNLSIVLQQVTIIGVVALAQTLIILTAGIDLSVGAMLVLSSIAMGRLAVDTGMPPAFALASGIGIGTLCGALNGFFVTAIRLPPFIVTLGTLSVFSSLVQLWSAGQTIRQQEIEAVAPVLQWTGTAMQFGAGPVDRGFDPDAAAGGAAVVCPQPHGLWPPCLCRGR